MEAALLSPEQDAEAIVRDLGIPPCPEILLKVLREMRQDDPDFAKIGNLISSDVSLAAATLETVNAAAFGLRTKVASVDKALSLLGLRNVKDVVTGLLLREALPIDDSAALDHFWDTSSAVAQTAALIARPLAKLDREDAYTFALFRDCGIPLMVRKFSDYDRFFTTAVSGARSFTAAERSHFSVDHACVGAHLARKWHLPDEMADAIALHHEYDVLSAGNTPVQVSITPDGQWMLAGEWGVDVPREMVLWAQAFGDSLYCKIEPVAVAQLVVPSDVGMGWTTLNEIWVRIQAECVCTVRDRRTGLALGEWESLDIALMNLMVGRALPGTEDADHQAMLDRIDDMAELLKAMLSSDTWKEPMT